MSTQYVEIYPQLSSVTVGDTVQVSPLVQARSTTATVTATSLAAGATVNLDPTAHKGYVLYSITASQPCRVRLYTNVAARTADADRGQFQSPTANSGLIAEAIFVSAGTVSYTPAVYGYNNESPITTTAPIAVDNTGSTTQTIDVSLTVLQLEAD